MRPVPAVDDPGRRSAPSRAWPLSPEEPPASSSRTVLDDPSLDPSTLPRRIEQAWRSLRALADQLAHPRATTELPAADPRLIRATSRVVAPICQLYFRSQVRHFERVPSGQTMVVGHHDGGLLPLDGLCLGVGWHHHFRFERPLRVLMHELPFHVCGPLTRWLHGIGIVSAAPGNLEAVLDRGESVLVYPGAAREAFRPFLRRREIDLGGRTGFVRRALRRGIPITPIASAGAHETMFILRRGARFAHWTGVYKYFHADAWPLALGLPWGIWFGPMIPYLPLPSRITVEVLPPIDLRDELSARLRREVRADDADDREVVGAGFELVRDTMQRAVHRLYAERRFPVIG